MNNMNKYLVIGNPINHSLSPKLHNYWFRKNNINAFYDKEKLDIKDLKTLVARIRDKEIKGANVTIPFKKDIIPYLDELTDEAKSTQSVNTIYLNHNKVTGHNTDIDGFKSAIRDTQYDINGKKIFILGAGGVVPSLIFALYKLNVSVITVSNRTKRKAEKLRELFDNLKIVDWGEVPEFDMIINATSLGLSSKDDLNLDFSKGGNNKFFYDIIYNPKQTNFLEKAKMMGHKIENGRKMFIYQAAAAFNIWHDINPIINDETVKLLD